LKIREVKETSSMKKLMTKIMSYTTNRYGSIHAFKLLKYFLEHQIAREKGGFATYEMTFNIAPSLVLTRHSLVKIECIADDAQQKDAEEGLDLLVQKGILVSDPETGILELNGPLDSIINVYLKETENCLEVIQDKSSADVILFPVSNGKPSLGKKDDEIRKMGSVPDLLYKDKRGRYTLLEIKPGRFPK
jgi:hypothetical protein